MTLSKNTVTFIKEDLAMIIMVVSILLMVVCFVVAVVIFYSQTVLAVILFKVALASLVSLILSAGFAC